MLPLTEVVFRSILSFGGVRSRFHLFALYYIVPSCNVGHASTYGCHYYSSTGPGSETSPNSFGQILTQAHYLFKLQPFSISSATSTTNPSQVVSFSAAAAGPHQRSAAHHTQSTRRHASRVLPPHLTTLHPHLYVTLIWIPCVLTGLTHRVRTSFTQERA